MIRELDVFKKTEEILGVTYTIDLIIPSDILLIVPTREGLNDAQMISIPLYAENLKFHLLDFKSFQTVSEGQEITIAVPDIRTILQIWKITGNNIHSCILKSTYHNIRTIEISSVLKKYAAKPDPTICVVKSTEDECKILCFDQIPKRELNMEYQNIGLELQVPTEWPFQQLWYEILRMTLRSILYHAAGKQVILTTNNVSVRLIPYEYGIGYIFERIEELLDNFFQVVLIIPSKIILLFNGEISVITIEDKNLEFHSRNLEGRGEITIAVPNFRRILKMKNIVGNQIYRSVFMSTYRNIGIME